MNNHPDNLDQDDIDPEIQLLLEELANETLTEQDAQVLREYIRCDPAVRAAYLDTMSFEAIMEKEFSATAAMIAEDSSSVVVPMSTPQQGARSSNIVSKSSSKSRWIPLALGGLGIAATLLVSVYVVNQGAPTSDPDQLAGVDKSDGPDNIISISTTVARVTANDAAVWSGGQKKIEVGTWLRPGKYELSAGSAEITFDSGASVILTKGSVFEILNANAGYLHEGEISSHVPEAAIGFLIDTPDGQIRDLGTRFGLSVNSSGSTDVHVLEGLVEAMGVDSDTPVAVVQANNALRLKKNKPSKVDYSGGNYMVNVKSKEGRIGSSYLHYSFDDLEHSKGVSKDSGFRPDGKTYNSKVITPKDQSPTWSSTKGRFGKSIYLTGDGTHLKSKYREITGDAARTLSFWVKIPPATPRKHAYAFAAWGMPVTQKGEKWQVSWNGNLYKKCGNFGAVRTEFGNGYVVGTTDLRDGRWHHIVSVYQGDNGEHISSRIRHYVDGKLEGVSGYLDADVRVDTAGNAKPLIIGHYLNFGQKNQKGLKAWMDEFYLFEAALTPEQIKDLYLHNKAPAEQDYLPSLFIE